MNGKFRFGDLNDTTLTEPATGFVVVVVSRLRASGHVDDDRDRLSDSRECQRPDVAECADHPRW